MSMSANWIWAITHFTRGPHALLARFTASYVNSGFLQVASVAVISCAQGMPESLSTHTLDVVVLDLARK